jgi:hypothetical protein
MCAVRTYVFVLTLGLLWRFRFPLFFLRKLPVCADHSMNSMFCAF